MRLPKPRGEVRGVSDPQPRLELSSDQFRDVLDRLDEINRNLANIIRKNGSSQSPGLPGIGGKVGALGFRDVPRLEKIVVDYPFRRVPGSQKTLDALPSRHVPGIRGDPERNKHHHQGSSSSAPTLKMLYCRICMQSKPFFKFFAIKGCKHSYCSTCLGSYIEAKVNMNVTLISCPGPACKDGKLEPLACKPLITKKVFDRWCDVLCESTVREKFYCPFKDCSALLIDERGREVMEESECPHCHRLFCARCRVPWHAGLSCRKFQEMAKLGREKQQVIMLMELAKKSKWQKCPKCKFYVEKISGCMFIKCRLTLDIKFNLHGFAIALWLSCICAVLPFAMVARRR